MVRFSDVHSFDKPNDVRALDLMDTAAKTVLNEYKDVVMAFGESDEYRWAILSLRNQTFHSQKSASYYEELQPFITGAAGEWTCPVTFYLLSLSLDLKQQNKLINSVSVHICLCLSLGSFFPEHPFTLSTKLWWTSHIIPQYRRSAWLFQLASSRQWVSHSHLLLWFFNSYLF